MSRNSLVARGHLVQDVTERLCVKVGFEACESWSTVVGQDHDMNLRNPLIYQNVHDIILVVDTIATDTYLGHTAPDKTSPHTFRTFVPHRTSGAVRC